VEKENFEQQEQSIDIKSILFKIIHFWYLFAITITSGIVIAYCFNRYSVPVYEAKTTILIQDDKKKSSFTSQDFMNGMGLFSKQKNIDHEIGILKSYTLTEKVVKELGFNITYIHDGNM